MGFLVQASSYSTAPKCVIPTVDSCEILYHQKDGWNLVMGCLPPINWWFGFRNHPCCMITIPVLSVGWYFTGKFTWFPLCFKGNSMLSCRFSLNQTIDPYPVECLQIRSSHDLRGGWRAGESVSTRSLFDEARFVSGEVVPDDFLYETPMIEIIGVIFHEIIGICFPMRFQRWFLLVDRYKCGSVW